MTKNVYVGGTLKDAGKRFSDSWNRVKRGERISPQDNITFLSWSALASVMTDRRHELLCHLRRHPAVSVSALARDLGRDYKRVHEDVSALAKVGLVEKEGRSLRANYDEIRTIIQI